MSRKWSGPRLASALFAVALVAAGCRTGDPVANQIVDKNAEARGGLKAWRKVQALSMTGTVEAGTARDPMKQVAAYLKARTQTKAELRRAALKEAKDGEERKQVKLPFVMELKRPRQSRVEIRFQGATAVQVYDGSTGWKLRPFLGRREVEPFNAEELRLASQQADVDGPLIDASKKGSTVEFVATEKVEGKDAYRLKVTSAGGQVRNVWVDAKTYLDVKVDGTRVMDGKPRTVWTMLRDYKAVDGLMIPHTLETVVEGVGGSEKIEIERVSVNPELALARFEKPAK